MEKTDVIIVGAGCGGLAAAAVLAKEEKKVLVLEKSHTPGGFATTFRRGRFEFDVSLHELCGFGRHETPFGGVRQLFDNLGISDRIDWIDIPEAYRLITRDSEGPIDINMPFGIKEYTDAMEKAVPGSRKGMEFLFNMAAQDKLVLDALAGCKTPSQQLKVLAKNRDFLHFAPLTLNEGMSQIDMPERARNIVKAYWAYICAHGDDLSFFYYLMMLNSYIELKSVVPAARGFEISETLTEYIFEHGSRVLLNTEVAKININNNAVKSVITADGTEYFADTVICNPSPHVVFGRLIDRADIPENDLKRANFRTIAARGFCVYLGLDAPAKKIGLNNYSYFIFPDMNTIKQYNNMMTPDTNHVQNTVCLNAANPNASPEGTCILCITGLFTSDYWSNVKPENYLREKTVFADSLISDFEKSVGVDLRSHIEEIEIATPETFARFTGAAQGSIYGYLGKKNDGVFARQLTENARSSGIEGLYFVGGTGNKLNGYSSAMSSGNSAANSIIKANNGGIQQ